MKNILLLLAFINTGALAQTQYFYGPNGQSQGTASTYGNTTYFYGPSGQSAGTASTYGNTTYYYGPQGQSQGQTINQGNPAPLLNAPAFNQPRIPGPLYSR
jgi:YD repeat-containing protein